MTQFQMTAAWSFASPFHVGTGLTRPGVDRAVRTRERLRSDDEDEDDAGSLPTVKVSPELYGEAFKGAVRGSAERIVRWLMPGGSAEESDNSSIPQHPALRRIFAGQHGSVRGQWPTTYRFSQPRYLDGGTPGKFAATAIDPERGAAKEHTLRVMEQWSANAYFAVTIDGRGGSWNQNESRDYLDLVLLVAAFVATSHVGGKKGNGLGETAISGLDLSMNLIPIPLPTLDAPTLERLKVSLIQEGKKNA